MVSSPEGGQRIPLEAIDAVVILGWCAGHHPSLGDVRTARRARNSRGPLFHQSAAYPPWGVARLAALPADLVLSAYYLIYTLVRNTHCVVQSTLERIYAFDTTTPAIFPFSAAVLVILKRCSLAPCHAPAQGATFF